ncbi:hypothetical protein TIFTF001_027781 [Ficus carica]|uniref:Uncharacterized protein n=1 Tax=Ficus carica TaxID=3494 RepID=A0AA88DP13_FICCA|nr:hypothetical protein TIFTF001_027781 [Ficus carica]
MSNSDLFLLQDHDENSCPLSFLDESCRASPSDQADDNSDHHHDQDDLDDDVVGQPDDDHHQEMMTKDEAKKKEVVVLIPYDEERPKTASSSLGELDSKVDIDDDGFKTPTSLDHKIPVTQHCPAAPRKPRISSKRKAVPSSGRTSSSSTTACRSLQLDFSEQIESMFPELQCHRKIKKARRTDREAQ